MSFDLDIELRIRDKQGKSLTGDEFSDGFVDICSWSSRNFRYIRDWLIDICNKYLGKKYSYTDMLIPVTESALREMYAFLIKNSYVDGEAIGHWSDKYAYESVNLANAKNLHNLLCMIDSIKFDNRVYTDQLFISDKNNREHFNVNPRIFDIEFRLSNHDFQF